MPIDPVSAAVVGSILNNAVQQISNISAVQRPAVTQPVSGVPRMFPEGTVIGEMVVTGPTSAILNNQQVLMSPAVQIRNTYNMIMPPGIAQPLGKVRYQTDVTGAVTRVWILTQAEASQP